MMKNIIRAGFVAMVSLLLAIGGTALAAYNDVLIEAGGNITLPGNGLEYSLSTDTAVESFTINNNSVDFAVASGSYVKMTSANRSSFSASSNSCTIKVDCGSSQSYITIESCSSSQTITVTVGMSDSCQSSGGGGNTGGGGGGGGGGASAPVTPVTPVAPVAPISMPEVTVTLALNTPTQVDLGGIKHTLTAQSATASSITLKVQSEPITLSLKKGEAKDIDTDGNKITDTRVVYLGLDGNKPKVKLIKLATADQKSVTISCPLSLEKAYKKAGNAAVYYITTDCTKRAFNRPDIFFTYFKSWSDVTLTTSEKLASVSDDKLGFMPYGPLYDPQYGALVKIVSDPKVYLLLGTERYWITSEDVFNKLVYKWNWIEDVDPRLLNKYTTGSEINYTDKHPNYTLVKYSGDQKVYRIEPDSTDKTKQVKRHIKDEKAFKKLKYRWDRIVLIPASEVYTDGNVLE